ncbi:Qat anti-phage system QueC-like protein QatC [Pseudomonas sp. CR3202]|uniref:Qat anti-phage system QueC-like protein QatC n=1 Tax=Pseudomonas sp. CR3202 TaxID=3351532 RepID=UPI003BF2FA9E
MKSHSLICRLGSTDNQVVPLHRPGSTATDIQFLDGDTLSFGIGQAIMQLSSLGLTPSETSIDLAILAALVTAADTRISRPKNSQNAWTREIDLYLPVGDIALWSRLDQHLARTLNFLTGDRWRFFFRDRPAGIRSLAPTLTKLRTAHPTGVCLFSGGLDSFIGAVDLISEGEEPLLVSHYWDNNSTSPYQNLCMAALKKAFPQTRLNQIQARVGFPKGTVTGSVGEDTLRGRSFLFFALAALAADATGETITIHVPENGLISLNVPLDPTRLGALSTRTTHPFYMARVNELFRELGLTTELYNRYAHRTKGQMAQECQVPDFLKNHAHLTMSCSSPGKARFARDASNREPKHCGYCVPCIIRRAAILEGCGRDKTRYLIQDLHAQVLNTAQVEGQHVRSFQLALSRLRAMPGQARFDIHRPGPLTDHPDDWDKYERVYVEGLLEVEKYLVGVSASPL